MARRRRPDYRGGWFHVMNRGVDHQRIFFSDHDRVGFGRVLGVAADRFGVEVHAYCLMPNHFHLLLHCPDGGLSDFMHHVAATHARHVNDRIGRDGPLFRGRFRSIPIDSDAYLSCVVRYIHRNPLELPDVHTVDDYRWSSHRTYVGHRRRPTWLRTDVVLSLFDDDVATYDEFVRGETSPFEHVSADQWRALIELIIEEQQIGTVHDNRAAVAAVSMLLLDRPHNDRQAALAARLAPQSPGARRTALSRARKLANADPTLYDIADLIGRLAA